MCEEMHHKSLFDVCCIVCAGTFCVLNYMLVYRSTHYTQQCSFIFFCNCASPLLQKNNITLECYVSKLQDITDFLHLRAETEWAINMKRQQKDSELSACNKVGKE